MQGLTIAPVPLIQQTALPEQFETLTQNKAAQLESDLQNIRQSQLSLQASLY